MAGSTNLLLILSLSQAINVSWWVIKIGKSNWFLLRAFELPPLMTSNAPLRSGCSSEEARLNIAQQTSSVIWLRRSCMFRLKWVRQTRKMQRRWSYGSNVFSCHVESYWQMAVSARSAQSDWQNMPSPVIFLWIMAWHGQDQCERTKCLAFVSIGNEK